MYIEGVACGYHKVEHLRLRIHSLHSVLSSMLDLTPVNIMLSVTGSHRHCRLTDTVSQLLLHTFKDSPHDGFGPGLSGSCWSRSNLLWNNISAQSIILIMR